MTLTSRSALIQALASGQIDDLRGTAESPWLDFKAAPYGLDTDKSKFELCKDVAAFANAVGGLLVVGVGTQKQADRAVELAASFQPFPQGAVDVGRYYDVINEHLRPRVAVTHTWHRDPGRSTVGDRYYLVFEIEPVPERDRWVIVRRILNDKGTFADGVAVPQRHGDRTVFLPPEEIYRLINQGLWARDLALELPRMPHKDLAVEADASLDTLQRLLNWDDAPVLYWQSVPPRHIDILPDLHGGDGIRGSLDRQKVLRPSGFNFANTLGRLRVHEGGLLLNKSDRAALWVRPEGIVTAAALATPAMLNWAMESRSRDSRLNTIVLTELTLEFFRIADEIIAPRVPGEWRHRIVARRFQGDSPRCLGPGGINFGGFLSDASQASADTWDKSWSAIGEPERDAFEALQRIYALFGVDVSTNPDVSEDRVSMQRFRDG